MTKAFISYSRRDHIFANRLVQCLKREEIDSWVDWESIPYSADWWKRIENGIESSEIFICILTPDYLVSKACNDELAYAFALNKRIVPVVRRELRSKGRFVSEIANALFGTELEVLAQENEKRVSKLNYLFFRKKEGFDCDYDPVTNRVTNPDCDGPVSDADSFEDGFQALLKTVDEDPEHVAYHTRLTVRASEWKNENRNASYLLGGDDLLQAQNWLQKNILKDPKPTPLIEEYIGASFERDQQRKRKERTAIIASLIVMTILFIISVIFSITSQTNLSLAESRGTESANNAATSQSNAITATNAQGVAVFSQQTAVSEANQRATQQSLAERSAAISQSLAFSSSARENFANANYDLASYLALASVNIPNPPIQSQRALYQAAYLPGTRHLFQGDWGLVLASAFSADSRFALIGTSDGKTMLFDVVAGQLVRYFGNENSFRGVIAQVGFSPDNREVFSVSEFDERGIVWDVNTGEQLRTFSGDPIWGSTLSPDGSIYIFEDLTQYAIVDTATGEEIGRMERSDNQAIGYNQKIAISPDNQWAITASDHISEISPQNIVLWDLVNLNEMAAFTVLDRGPVAIASDNRTALIGSLNNLVVVWDIITRTELRRFSVPFPVNTISFTPDHEFAIIGGTDGTLILWNIETGETVYRLSGAGSVLMTKVSPNGRFLLSSTSQAGEFRLWDLTNGQQVARYANFGFSVTSLSQGLNRQLLLTTTSDGYARLWDQSRHELIREIKPPGREIGSFLWGSLLRGALSPDGKIAVLTDDGVALWNTETGEIGQRYQLPESDRDLAQITTVAFSPNGRDIAYFHGEVYGPGAMIIQNIHNLDDIKELQPTDDRVLHRVIPSLVFNRDGSHLLASEFGIGSDEGFYRAVVLYDVATQKPIRDFTLDGSPTAAIFDSDETHILASTDGGEIFMWAITSGEIVRRYEGHSSAVISLAQHDDILASGDYQGTVIIWDMNTAEEIFRFRASPTRINSMVFSGDNLVVGSDDGLVGVWRIVNNTNDAIDWLYNNRYIPALTCDQIDRFANFSSCTGILPEGETSATPVPTLPVLTTFNPPPYSLSTTVDGYCESWGGQLWSFIAHQGDTISITMQATEMDGVLQIRSLDGKILVQDDDSGGGINPAINGFSIPVTGEYLIGAENNSLTCDREFTYTLTLSVALNNREMSLPELIRVKRGIIGIVMHTEETGIGIQSVLPGSPAEDAGLRDGDVIIAINGSSTLDIANNISATLFPVDTQVMFTIRRGDQQFDLAVTFTDPAAITANATANAPTMTPYVPLDTTVLAQALPSYRARFNTLTFEEDWSDNHNGWSQYELTDGHRFDAGFSDGVLRVVSTSFGNIAHWLPSVMLNTLSIKDGRVELRFRLTGNPTGGIGIAFRMHDDGTFYNVIVLPIGVYLSDGSKILQSNTTLFDLTQYVNVTIVFIDQSLAVYLDDEPILSFNDLANLNPGKLNLSIYYLEQDEPVHLDLDAMRVYSDAPLPTATPSATPSSERLAVIGDQQGVLLFGGSDVWLYPGKVGERLTIQVMAETPLRLGDGTRSSEANTLDTLVRIYSPQGNLLTENDDTGQDDSTNSSIEDFVLTTDGTYRIEVRSWNNRGAGTYTLNVSSSESGNMATAAP